MNTIVTRSRSKRKALLLENEPSKKIKLIDEKRDYIQNEIPRKKSNMRMRMAKLFEEELRCNICTEILLKPTILNCSHIFCEFCIFKWMKEQLQCPMCREKISTQMRIWVFDIYIEKALRLLLPEQKIERKNLIEQRELESRPKPRRSLRLKNKSINTNIALEESGLHLRHLIDEVLQLAQHFSL